VHDAVDPRRSQDPTADERAERLKERVYVTVTGLAVVLALRSNGESPGKAALTLIIAVFGTLLAVLLADIVSHIAVCAALPTNGELREMVAVSFAALGAVVVPFVLVGLALAAAGRSTVPLAPRRPLSSSP